MQKQVKPKVTVNEKNKAVYITTSQGRVSFPKIIKAEAMQGSTKKKFSLSLLFPKKHDRKYLIEAVDLAAKMFWGEKNMPKKLTKPFADGDAEEYDGYAGNMVLKLSAQEESPIVCIGLNKEPIDPKKIYAGCWVRASISIKAYEVKGEDGKVIKRGVGAYCQGLQFLSDDEPFGNKRDVTDDFGDDDVSEFADSDSEESYEDADADTDSDEESEW
jgi:hypothetical protein